MHGRTFRFLILAVITASLFVLSSFVRLMPLSAQTSGTSELYYFAFDRKIPLSVREDAIAVSFKPTRPTRGGATRSSAGESFRDTPLYLQLQQDLQTEERTRSGATRGPASRRSRFSVVVNPLGKNYALVNVLSGTAIEAQERIEAQPYVQTTLPVLTSLSEENAIVLPNEIILNFQPDLSPTQRQAILTEHNLEIIKPLRFTQNRYLVRSTIATGLGILGVTHELSRVNQIQSATPNFIQTFGDRDFPDYVTKANPPIATSEFLPMQWHLDSTLLTECLKQRAANSEPLQDDVGKCLQNNNVSRNPEQPRADIRATEAWQHSAQGEGVIVAVIDSWIQWDHPDLIGNLYQTGTTADALPGEVNGWDFVEDDPDTRVSAEEFKIVGAQFEDAFLLPDEEIQEFYPGTLEEITAKNPNLSKAEIIKMARSKLANSIAGEFHGTMVAGVVAARPQSAVGAIGVAPKAKILPARVMGMHGSFSLSGYLEAIAYSAARGADIINISLGSSLPAQGEIELISEILQDNPKLVIVASAGNQNRGSLGFPAAIPGVVAVGATNIQGNRASYSNFGFTAPDGQALTVVAPGGDGSEPQPLGKILTTGGTGSEQFWENILPITSPKSWGPNLDERGNYRWTTGTSFSSPAVAGVMALMKGEDLSRTLTRDRLVTILKETSSYEELKLTSEETKRYNNHGSDAVASPKAYFFGSGLVNADAAVRTVQNSGM